MFGQLVAYINGVAGENFKSATQKIRDYVEELELDDFQEIVKNIGTIPENIVHDSTEEKLYSKASDIVLSRCFRFLGMDAKALDERADSADILAESTKGY